MAVCIGPDTWVSLTAPSNLVIGYEQPAIRYEPASDTYRLKGSFKATGSVSVGNFSASLPNGITVGFIQAFRTMVYTPSAQGEPWRADESGLIFHTDGTYNIMESIFTDDFIAFDGIELIP